MILFLFCNFHLFLFYRHHSFVICRNTIPIKKTIAIYRTRVLLDCSFIFAYHLSFKTLHLELYWLVEWYLILQYSKAAFGWCSRLPGPLLVQLSYKAVFRLELDIICIKILVIRQAKRWLEKIALMLFHLCLILN